MVVANTLTYYSTATITTVKSFIGGTILNIRYTFLPVNEGKVPEKF
jgi:hypothetical protein